MSASERPAKRIRQACDNCRRKKSRCPGEKPVCSYCSRLNQQCTYTDEGLLPRQVTEEPQIPSTPARSVPAADQISTDTSKRLNDLETKLSEVLVALSESRKQPSSVQQSPIPYSQPAQQFHQTTPSSASFQNARSSRETLQEVADLYLKYCHCQPLPLFVADQFAERLRSRDEEVILSVSAIALRFSPDASRRYDHKDTVESYLEKTRSLLVHRIHHGPIELSTMQSLCILSWLDFYDGNTRRASMYTSLVSDLCKSADLAASGMPDNVNSEEKLRCFWSIVLLQRLHPNISGPINVTFDEDVMPPYPKSSSRPVLQHNSVRALSEGRTTDHKDLGILAYAIQLTEVWYKVTRYVHRRAAAGPYPPWSSKSEYAKIIAHQMEGETAMPYSKHRFKPARFDERSPEDLFAHRSYWSPWLFTQILYHTIVCVLNHPLLLSLRLRNFRVASIPEIWLQHTDDLIAQHSQWIIHILDLLEEKSYIVSDPFLAHCVAIVATIHLQQSFGDDGDIQQVKKESFAKCLRFCQKIGEQWPFVNQIALKLQQFELMVSTSHTHSAASQANDKIFIDLSLFWEILESAAISEKADTKGLVFGHSLRSNARPSMVTEELNTRLLPEPARVAAAGSPAGGLITQHTPNTIPNAVFTAENQPFYTNDDFNVLAQSYFAQGQDFVGNMDDWWLMDGSNQPV